MGIRSGNFVFLRPAQHGGKDRTGRPGSREKEIEFERYPSFQKRDAQALRFGSMNSISKVLGGDLGRILEHLWMLCGGVSRIVSIDLGTILGYLWMLFGGVAGRNEHTMGIRGVGNGVFEATIPWGFWAKL